MRRSRSIAGITKHSRLVLDQRETRRKPYSCDASLPRARRCSAFSHTEQDQGFGFLSKECDLRCPQDVAWSSQETNNAISNISSNVQHQLSFSSPAQRTTGAGNPLGSVCREDGHPSLNQHNGVRCGLSDNCNELGILDTDKAEHINPASEKICLEKYVKEDASQVKTALLSCSYGDLNFSDREFSPDTASFDPLRKQDTLIMGGKRNAADEKDHNEPQRTMPSHENEQSDRYLRLVYFLASSKYLRDHETEETDANLQDIDGRRASPLPGPSVYRELLVLHDHYRCTVCDTNLEILPCPRADLNLWSCEFPSDEADNGPNKDELFCPQCCCWRTVFV